MKTFFCFLLGLVIGFAGHWYISQPSPADRVVHRDGETGESPADQRSSSDEIFDDEKIKDELARTGRVIREKAKDAGDAIADATANTRVTAAIKSKLVKDTGLSAFKIDVDTTDGVVTLSGNVSSHQEIDKAMDLALETEGVRKVISTLQVKQ